MGPTPRAQSAGALRVDINELLQEHLRPSGASWTEMSMKRPQKRSKDVMLEHQKHRALQMDQKIRRLHTEPQIKALFGRVLDPLAPKNTWSATGKGGRWAPGPPEISSQQSWPRRPSSSSMAMRPTRSTSYSRPHSSSMVTRSTTSLAAATRSTLSVQSSPGRRPVTPPTQIVMTPMPDFGIKNILEQPRRMKRPASSPALSTSEPSPASSPAPLSTSAFSPSSLPEVLRNCASSNSTEASASEVGSENSEETDGNQTKVGSENSEETDGNQTKDFPQSFESLKNALARRLSGAG